VPTFAGVNLGEVQIFLELRHPEPDGAGVYFVVGVPTSCSSTTAPTASRSS
jgi:hypothetical protein